MLSKLKGVVYTLVGIYESIKIFNRFKPDVVVGVGGYVSGPVVLAAFVKRISRVICEQNSYPGITNRVLSYFAGKVFITYEKSRSFFNEQKIIVERKSNSEEIWYKAITWKQNERKSPRI